MSLSTVIRELEDQVVLDAKDAYSDTDYNIYVNLVQKRLWKCWPRDNVSGLLVRIVNIISRSAGMISSKISGGKVIYKVRFTAELLDPKVGDNIQITVKRVNKAGIFGTAGPTFILGGHEESSIRALIPGKNLEGRETDIYANGQEIIGTIEAIQLAQERTISVICTIHYFDSINDLIGHYMIPPSQIELTEPKLKYSDDIPITDQIISSQLDDLENLIQRERIGDNDSMWSQMRAVTDALNMLYPSKQSSDGLVIKGYGTSTSIQSWPIAVPKLNYEVKGKELNLNPLSRAFYKGLEMFNQFSVVSLGKNITAAMMAEGPGGFIMALFYYMNRTGMDISNSVVHAITLFEKGSHLNFNPQLNDLPLKVNISKGVGDLTDIKVAEAYIAKVGRGKAELCTADGGIQANYESQEQECMSLLYAEMVISLAVQKIGGMFIIKLFGMNTTAMLEMIALLTQVYQNTVLYKPSNSRMGNREIYMVCVDYKGLADSIIDELIKGIGLRRGKKYIEKVFDDNFTYSPDFVESIINYTKESNQKQAAHINDTLRLINWVKMQRSSDSTKYLLNMYNEKQLEYAVDWCSRFNTEINDIYSSS